VLLPTRLIGFGAGGVGGGTIVSVTLTDSDSTSANQTNYTWGTKSIGAAPTGTNRRFVLCIGHLFEENPNTYVRTDIDGVAADEEVVSQVGNSSAITSIAYSEIASGTTLDVTTRYGNQGAGAGIGIYSIITTSEGLALIDTDAITSEGNMTLATDASGFMICGATNRSGGSHTWSNGPSEDYDLLMQFSSYCTGATVDPTATDSADTVTIATGTPTDFSAVAASFKPAG
jgi:hypothetical protein